MCCNPPQAAADRWNPLVGDATEVAKKEGKDLLMYFSGGKDCKPCALLEDEVFQRDEFQIEITSEFELVRLAFEGTQGLPQSFRLQTQRWAKKFGVTRYPTVVLVDKDMVPFAITGYEKGGLENYLGLLSEFHKIRVDRDENLALAEKAEGLERAKFLDQALSGMNEGIVEVYYPEIIEEIVKLDAENQLGLKSKWNSEKEAELRKVIMTDLMLAARLQKPTEAIKAIDSALGEVEFEPTQMLEILQIKLNLVRRLKDPKAVDQLLDQMIALPGVEGTTQERLIVKKIMLMWGGGRKEEARALLKDTIDKGQVIGARALYLRAADGELLMAENKYADAIAAFDAAIPLAKSSPDALIELVSGKAEALFEMGKQAEALQELDNLAEDTTVPSDLRAEATLHKSMLMRELGKSRLAKLSENRAVEIAETPKLKGEFQKVVQRLRQKYEAEAAPPSE